MYIYINKEIDKNKKSKTKNNILFMMIFRENNQKSYQKI